MTDTSIATLVAHFAKTNSHVDVINPANGKRIYELPQLTAEQVAIEVDRARDAQDSWSATPVTQRADIMLRFHDAMQAEQNKILDLLQLETGKSRAHALEEFAGALGAARYFAKIADRALSAKRAKTGIPVLLRSTVSHVPVGVVGVIIPWNYPLALAVMDVAPALMAGNTVVHKSDNQTTLVSLFVRQLAVAAGLPADAWRIVVGDGPTVGNAVTDAVDYVAFTGSTATGKKVAARAAERLIGASLELGGKNPAIVLPGADLAKAARQIAVGSFGNGGQLCVSLSRIYVPKDHKAAFEREFVAVASSLKVGRSSDFTFDIGTLTSQAQLDRVKRFLSDALGKGARLLTGGKQLAEVGPYFFEPTVITDVPETADLYREEVFGPVIAIYGYDTVDDAVNLANDSIYGLNAAVFGNEREAKRVAHRIEAGSVNINEGYRASFASFGAPMGGFKQSGQGRRNGVGGLLRFTEARSIGVAKSILGIGLPNTAKQWKTMAPLMDRLATILRRLP